MPQPQHKKDKRPLIAGFVLIFSAGILLTSLGWYFYMNAGIGKISQQIKPLRQANNTYEFIDPLLGYDVPGNVKEFNEYQPLETAIQNTVSREPNAVAVTSYGVYFRDLTLGRWMGVNQDTGFAPGSMMKVAIMIAYFKEAEDDPDILNQTLVYSSTTADELNGIPFETPSNLQVGKAYTVEQLIEAMIISSDNGAKNALLGNIDQASLGEIYTDLSLPAVSLDQDYNDYAISPKQYSVLLRVLYNATYLSRAYSEKALQIMSDAEYAQGLVAGVPQGIPVAQKFGESVDNANPGPLMVTLSNCGVVYHPSHPYILCVMTKGTDVNVLAETIASISKTVWDEVDVYAMDQNY